MNIRSKATDRALSLRAADVGDGALLFGWVNSPDARAAALADAEPVAWETHVAWLDARLADAGCRIWIVERDGAPLGTVRLQVGDKGTEVSIFVAPAGRGGGVASWAIDAALAAFGTGKAVARVRAGNRASRRLFESLGFTVRERAGGRLVYVRARGAPV